MLDVVKYLLEGLAVIGVSHYVSRGMLDVREIVILGLAAAITFLVLDLFAPSVSLGARQGSGFAIGKRLIEGFPDDIVTDAVNDITGGAGAHSRPIEDFDPTESNDGFNGGGVVSQGDEHQPYNQPYNQPYKLVDGHYSAKVLRAGYNENVRCYNDDQEYCSYPAPWAQCNAGDEPLTPTQLGGATEHDKPFQETLPESSVPEVPEAPETQEIPEQELKFDKNYRETDVLYSGDLILISSNGRYLQRGTVDSQLLLDKPFPQVGTNLSKLRFVHANKHSPEQQLRLDYGEPVFLMHNAYFNHTNSTKFIKYGDRLQSHQDGQLYRTFKIYNAQNPQRRGGIDLSQEVVITRGDQDGTNIYLKVEQDKGISSASANNMASKFQITLVRVNELYNRNLCVCPTEIIYP